MKYYTERVKALQYCMAKEDGITICEPCPYYDKGVDCENALHTDAAAAIEALQAELPKRGEWIHGRELGKEWVYDHWVTYFENWRCSNCSVVFEQESKPKYHYCPNCGAKMEVQE